MCIHACIKCLLPVLFKSIRCHGYDRNSSSGIPKISYHLCCLISIHFRHLNIHKNHIIIICRLLFQHLHTFFSICSPLHKQSLFFKNRQCNFCIQLIIFCNQNSFSFNVLRHKFFFFLLLLKNLLLRGNLEWNHDRRLCSFAGFTLYFYCSSHQINQSLHNRKPQTCSDYFAFRTCMFSGKFFKNMWKIVFTHPNSSIFNYNLICNIIFPVKRNLPDIYGDLATCRSIFQ